MQGLGPGDFIGVPGETALLAPLFNDYISFGKIPSLILVFVFHVARLLSSRNIGVECHVSSAPAPLGSA